MRLLRIGAAVAAATAIIVTGGTTAFAAIPYQIAQLDVTYNDPGATAPFGSVVAYSMTVTNNGNATYLGATAIDELADVLDDADYNGDATVTGPGSASLIGDVMTWTGDLAGGQTATITYSVTAHNQPSGGDGFLYRQVSWDRPLTNFVIQATGTTTPVVGSTATYTATLTAISGSGPLAATLDFSQVTSASGTVGTPVASSGQVFIDGSDSTATWYGPVTEGQVVTISLPVTWTATVPATISISGQAITPNGECAGPTPNGCFTDTQLVAATPTPTPSTTPSTTPSATPSTTPTTAGAVPAASGTATQSALPPTGTTTTILLTIGIGALAIGAVAVIARRRINS